MRGAEALVETLLGAGVRVCFANPGTSEMHFVAALDTHPDMHCVLCLFEGGVTGAADGYARMSGNVAATLLHLGPGFANGWANLHNARKGRSGIVNVVGDHAGHHLRHDAPLTADLDGVARSVSHWIGRPVEAGAVAAAGAEAIRAAQSANGQIATLILPADAAWSETRTGAAPALPPVPLYRPEAARVAAAAAVLATPGAGLLVGGAGLYGPMADLAGRIAARTGCRLIAPFFAPRIALGRGAVVFEHMLYLPDLNAEFLSGLETLICVGEGPPVNFFAYPNKPSTPEPPGCRIDPLCPGDWDVAWTLTALAEAAGVDGTEVVPRVEEVLPEPASGPLTPDAVGRCLTRAVPEGAIVVNEAVTAGFGIWPHLNRGRAHERINTTGGSIGQGLPAALGAAVACPDRPVFAVSGDGSAMYQIQTLWTMAREALDVAVLILSNRGYQILHMELAALGAPPAGRNARAMFDIEDPALDWVAMAKGHGVPAARAETGEALEAALAEAAATRGPFLIEAVI